MGSKDGEYSFSGQSSQEMSDQSTANCHNLEAQLDICEIGRSDERCCSFKYFLFAEEQIIAAPGDDVACRHTEISLQHKQSETGAERFSVLGKGISSLESSENA